MIARVGRLVRTEFIKLLAHPFLYISMVILILSVLAAVWFQLKVTRQHESVWRTLNAIQLFAYGTRFGLTVASYILVIFSSMLFASEFDRGTIKVLLTRPVTRTDLFVSKAIVSLLMCVFFYGLVLYVGLLYGSARGDLGPVWDDQHYVMQRSYADMVGHARKAILMGFLPLVAACFMGIAVSNLTESSAFAVATALILYVVLDIGSGFLGSDGRYLFNYYPSYAFDVLRYYSEGSATRWNPDIDKSLLAVKVPLTYSAGFAAVAYGLFRMKNIGV